MASPAQPPAPRPGVIATAGPSPSRGGWREPLWLALVGVALFLAALATRNTEVSWYGVDGWAERTRISVSQQQIGQRLTDFPVTVSLDGLSPRFWEHVGTACGDIRVTTADGRTELPRQVVTCDTSARTGQILLLAPSLSPRSDTRFYLYFGNPDATDYAPEHRYGAAALASYLPDASDVPDGGAAADALEAGP